MKHLLSIVCMLALAGLAPPQAAAADNAGVTLSEGFRFQQQDGESLYRAVCQGCHMPDGEGSVGAGLYPALAANPRLASATYPVATILRGRRNMPPFKRMLDDAQIAAVTNYVRTHMGNDYKDAVSAADVKSLR